MGNMTSYKRPDGKSVNGYLAEPAQGAKAPGMVVIQEWWGLTDQIKGVADKLAKAGYRALVPDLYRGKIALEANEAKHLMEGLNFGDAAGQDIRGAVQYLKKASPKVGVTGFCMGGGYAYLAAISGDVDAAVPFYGAGIAQHLGEAKCPILAFFGGTDEWIPRADIAEVEQHHPGDVVVYEDAQHGFMRDGSDTYHETAAPEAWQRMLAFFDQHLREH